MTPVLSLREDAHAHGFPEGSIAMSAAAWSTRLPTLQKFVLVAVAGSLSTNPEYLAEQTSMSVSAVDAILRTLEAEGVLLLP